MRNTMGETSVVCRGFLRALGLVIVLVAPCVGHASPTVILLSLDGVRSDYPDRARLPSFERMAAEGMRAERMRPVFPSNTFPNHVSLATGTYPDRHGILDNRFWDRKRGLYDYGKGDGKGPSWLEAEPLWAAVERQGIPAATFFWVGSETPWRGQTIRYAKAPFDEGVPEREKVDQILAWLELPGEIRPGLIMSWWHGADAAGHRFGPDSSEVIEALEGQDAELTRLFAGIDSRSAWDEVTVLVVSDHGMIAVNESVSPDEVLKSAGIGARVQFGSSVAHVFLDDPGDLIRARTVLADDEGLRIYRGVDLPDELRISYPQRNGDLVILIDPPRAFYQLSGLRRAYFGLRALWNPDAKLGMHGFDPGRSDMGAIFFALGRGVTPGYREAEIRAIDVAPTVARLLGIEAPAQSEGDPVPGVGENLR